MRRTVVAFFAALVVLAGCGGVGAQVPGYVGGIGQPQMVLPPIVLPIYTGARVGPPDAYAPVDVPGAIDPNITDLNVDQTVCREGGYTSSVRPPASYTTRLKIQQIARYQLPGDASLYEEDHAIPLALGGAPTSEQNLSPELWDGPFGAHSKDKVEVWLRARVCDHTMTLTQARTEIHEDWVAVLYTIPSTAPAPTEGAA